MVFARVGLFDNPTFEQSYHCYSVSFADKPHLENGGKVLMPASALDRLAHLNIQYPMLFEIQNVNTGRTSHCGVLEFVADEGHIYMPYWMMQNLLLQEGEIAKMKIASLPKGTFVKLRPHTTDFLDISNPKAVLEATLREYSCLTTNDTIMVHYNNKKYYIDIIETKPAPAVMIIETDCEVDFAPPLDYKEPERVPPPAPPVAAAGPVEDAAAKEPEEPKFLAFTGSGRRLDGKPSKLSVPLTTAAPTPTSASAATSAAAAPATQGSAPTVAAAGGRQLKFGGSSGVTPSSADKGKGPANGNAEAGKDAQSKENGKGGDSPSSFQAFSGKKYSLKG